MFLRRCVRPREPAASARDAWWETPFCRLSHRGDSASPSSVSLVYAPKLARAISKQPCQPLRVRTSQRELHRADLRRDA